MDAFCWLEADTADMFFFDMEYPIPNDLRYLARVWVCPEVRGQGLGRSLIVEAESFAASSGAGRLFSACVPHNSAMRRLFAELGWACQQGVDYVRAGPAMLFRIRAEGTTTRRAWSIPAAARLLSSSASEGCLSEPSLTSERGRAGTPA
jgi:GNAT superfamily N-acetyltransferase